MSLIGRLCSETVGGLLAGWLHALRQLGDTRLLVRAYVSVETVC